MDIDKLRNALMGLKGETPEIPYDTEANQRAAIEQANAAVENPNTQTKPERIEAVQEQESLETPQGQLDQAREIASVPSNPSAETNIRNAVDKTPQPSPEMLKYKALIDKMEAVQNAPKKEASTGDTVMNWLTGIGQGAKVYADINNVRTPNVDYWGDKTAKKAASAKKEELGGLKQLQDAYGKYMALQNKDAITPYQQKMLDDKKLDRKNALDIAKAKTKNTPKKLSVGEEQVDKDFGKKYSSWNTDGRADYDVNKKIFSDAIKDISDDKVDTGFFAGAGSKIPLVRTKTAELQSRVQKAINGMLRATLGSQFTEKEGERIFNQTFDPSASEAANIENMELELAKLDKRKEAMEDMGSYFRENNTMAGYTPTPLKETKYSNDKSEYKRPHIKTGKIGIFDSKTNKFLRWEGE